MDKILSIRKNNQVFSLFIKIQEYQKSANRTDIINAAIQKALDDRENGMVNWNTIASVKIPSIYTENDDFPEFIQLRVDEAKYGEIVNQMKMDFNLEKGSPAPFVVKLLLINYLLFLESNGIKIIKSKKEETIASKQKLMEEFKKLTSEEKMDAIYALLLDLTIR